MLMILIGMGYVSFSFCCLVLVSCMLTVVFKDVEMNRPGKNGFRVRKKKTDAAKVCTPKIVITLHKPQTSLRS